MLHTNDGRLLGGLQSKARGNATQRSGPGIGNRFPKCPGGMRDQIKPLSSNAHLHQLVLLAIVMSMFTTGCYREVLIRPEAVENSPTDDVVVTMKDVRKVRFSAGDYKIATDSTGKRAIVGKGKLFVQGGGSQFEIFQGSLRLDEIERISTSELGPGFYVLIVTVGLAAGFVVWALIHYPTSGQ